MRHSPMSPARPSSKGGHACANLYMPIKTDPSTPHRLCLSLLLSNLETTIASTSLVSISNALGGFKKRNWVITSYLTTYTGQCNGQTHPYKFFYYICKIQGRAGAKIAPSTGAAPSLPSSPSYVAPSSTWCTCKPSKIHRVLLGLSQLISMCSIIFRGSQGLGASVIYASKQLRWLRVT